MTKLTYLNVLLGSICAVMILFSGLANRFAIINFRTALEIYGTVVKASAAIAILALIVIIAGIIKQAPIKMAGINVGIFFIAGAIFASGVMFKSKAQSVPMIHDISTDTQNPPQFKAVLPLRTNAVNPVEYEGPEVADQQKKAYPDIKPMDLNQNKQKAFEGALDAAKNMNWEIVDQSLPEGRIEAVATTTFFGFKDDIVIRLSEISPESTRLDIRSLSRVGKSDVGANAARIRKYMEELKKNRS